MPAGRSAIPVQALTPDGGTSSGVPLYAGSSRPSSNDSINGVASRPMRFVPHRILRGLYIALDFGAELHSIRRIHGQYPHCGAAYRRQANH